MKIFSTILFMFSVLLVSAQETNSAIKNANDVYRKGDYRNAAELYKKVLLKDAKNNTAKFNLGNALQKQNNNADAEKYYDEITAAGDVELNAKALYNRGVAQAQQQKLTEAIESFKESLTLSPYDNDTRENLQKAINELKKKQQSAPQQDPKNQQKPQQDKNKNKQPDKQMLEQKFNELRDKEKQLQKMLQKKTNMEQPDKDW
ncbi:MAG TPA: tetratricopeptide repeat protein [Panacibacter sp.]|nr:tetratricopeptide repeat protein [Panacibacter sp.]